MASLYVPGAQGFSSVGNQAEGIADFYVATKGKDSNPGTAGAPFATLGRARQAVREKVLAGLTGNIRVLIGAGTYEQTETLTFGPEDSGTEKFSITYATSPGAEVVLNGGRRITGWEKGPSAIWTAHVPEVKAGSWYFRQLFINGKRAVRARTPNADDKTPWWTIKTSTATKESLPPQDAPIPVSVSGPIQAYNNPTDVELVYIFNNAEGRKRLGTINQQDQTFTLAPPHRWNPKVFAYDWALTIPSAGKACYLENALEMLDQPGEWYLDRQTGVLSYWPREGEDLTRAEVVAPMAQTTILAVIGTRERPVVNLHFKGIQVQYLDWPLPPWGYMPLFCCNLATGTDANPGHRFMDAAVEYEFAHSCSFTDGSIAHVGGMGICLRNGTAHNVIEGNDIFDLGAGGIGAGYAGFYAPAPPPEQNEYTGYRIANNYVHDCGVDYYDACGILLYPSQDAVVAHNLIHDTAYFGMGVAGSQDPKLPFSRNNAIEYNHIYNAMKVTIDGAGMYVTFAQADRGCLIRGNLIHDTQGNPFGRLDHPFGDHPPCAGIYLDGNNSGCHYENNVLYRNLAAGPIIFDYENAEQKNTWLDNLFQKEGTPPQEFIEAMKAHAGLEPAYQRSILRIEPNPCQYFSLAGSVAEDGWAAYQYDLPSKGRGVIEIVLRAESKAELETLKPRGLDAKATYMMKGYTGNLGRASVWGSGSTVMLSNVVPLPLSNTGMAKHKDKMTGRELLNQGLPTTLAKSPQVVWIVYQRLS